MRAQDGPSLSLDEELRIYDHVSAFYALPRLHEHVVVDAGLLPMAALR